jgi:hypothetical protein
MMKKNVVICVCLFLFLFISQDLLSTPPINNPYDPVQFHSVFGSDKYYAKKDTFSLNIVLSPFYQHASGARDSRGGKTSEGDVYGRWNMLGMFFGTRTVLAPAPGVDTQDYQQLDASPTDKQFMLQYTYDGNHDIIPNEATRNATNGRYKLLSSAWRVLDGIAEEHDQTPVLDDNPATGGDTGIDKNYTLEDNFDTDDNSTGHLSLSSDYEKFGVRGQICLEFSFGFGMKCKGGVVDYKQTGTCSNYTPAGSSASGTGSANEKARAQYLINKYLMNPYEQILNEVGIYTQEQKKTVFEDTYVELFWHLPWNIEDDDYKHVATVSPYVAVGVWFPTGKNKHQDYIFSVSTGADGFWGISTVGSINIDLPDLIQLSFGGGATFYESKTINGYRVPSSEYQSGVYPWKARIRKRPGAVWYLNASFKAYEFIERFSLFFDYVYSEHKRDSIIVQETTSTRNSYFKPEKIIDDSRWRTNVIHGGINYRVASGLDIGFSFQAHLSGARVYKTTTMMGTLNFNF